MVRFTWLKVMIVPVYTDVELGVPGLKYTAVTDGGVNTKKISAINETVIPKATTFFFISLDTIYPPSPRLCIIVITISMLLQWSIYSFIFFEYNDNIMEFIF